MKKDDLPDKINYASFKLETLPYSAIRSCNTIKELNLANNKFSNLKKELF